VANIAIPDSFAETPLAYVQSLSPSLVNSLFALATAVYRKSQLTHREFEAARVRIAQINGCLACRDFRSETDVPAYLASIGIGPDEGIHLNGPAPDEAFYRDIVAWRTAPHYNERERLVIEFAEGFACEPDMQGYDEAFWARMRSAFSNAEICDLVVATGYFVAAGRFMHVLGLDQVTCAV